MLSASSQTAAKAPAMNRSRGTGMAAESTKAMPPAPQKPSGFNSASSQILYRTKSWRIFFKIYSDCHAPESLLGLEPVQFFFGPVIFIMLRQVSLE